MPNDNSTSTDFLVAPSATSVVTPLIYSKMIAIMRRVGTIKKGRMNEMQHYAFRGIDDVYAELHTIMAEEHVFMTTTVINERTEVYPKERGQLIYRILTVETRFFAEDGSSVVCTTIGEAMDSGDKAANKAMSVGQKYAILQAFAIPTSDPKDPENDSPEPGKRGSAGKKIGAPADKSLIPDDVAQACALHPGCKLNQTKKGSGGVPVLVHTTADGGFCNGTKVVTNPTHAVAK